MSVIFNKLFVAFAVAFTLALAGCSTSGGGAVSGYTGQTVTSATAQRSTARKDVKKASRQVRAERRKIKKLERQIARDKRRLKRKKISAKRKKRAKKNLKANTRELRLVKRNIRKAERRLSRAERKERSANRAIRNAKERAAAAKRRFAEAEKRQQITDARAQLTREGSTPVFGTRLFTLSDPALKNIRDYQSRVDGGFAVAAIPVDKMNKRLLRQEVAYSTPQKAGTIVVDTGSRYLYLVKGSGRALRYGIGVGRQGFAWSGSAHIGWKQEWPKWTPPEEMIEREPQLAKYCADCGGMPGGPANPLGARALYLMKDGKDTLYRLHGTPQWSSIGTAASSGCIRLMNQDIIDLYGRVRNGTKVVVL